MRIITLFIIATTILSCKAPKNEFKFHNCVDAIGKDPNYLISMMGSEKWEYCKSCHGDSGYAKTYVYSQKDDPMRYFMFDKCNDNNTICELAYSINEDEYLNKIPKELIRLNFKTFEANNNENRFSVEYIKSGDIVIHVILGKTFNNSISHYSVRIRSLDLSPELHKLLNQKYK